MEEEGLGANSGDCYCVMLRFSYVWRIWGVIVGEDSRFVPSDYRRYRNMDHWGYEDRDLDL